MNKGPWAQIPTPPGYEKGEITNKKNIKNSMHIIVGRSSKLPPCVSREWLRRCLVALLEMAEETGASINWWCLLPKRLVLTVCNTSGWEWSWSKWFWYFCQLCVNSKMHLPIASNTDSKLAPRSGSGSKDIRRASCSSGLCGISYLQKLRDIYADIRYCWNLLCVIVTWNLCLTWTWWPMICIYITGLY